MKNTIIVAHKYLHQPDDDLVYYLNKKREGRVLHIKHSFPDAKDRRSFFDLFRKGKKIKKERTRDYIFLPEVFIYLKEFIFTLKWSFPLKIKWDSYIGMDGLTVIFGLVLQKLGICKKVVFWCIDFVPDNRFDKVWKNIIYQKINTFAVKGSNEVWDLSPRMAEGRKKFLGIKKKDYKFHKVVPYGLWLSRIKKYKYKDSQKHTLVFMGHLMPKQGVDMVIKKIPDIVKKIPDFKFKIIGGGNHKSALKKLAREMSVEKYCDFKGRIRKQVDMEREIAKAGVAIAPYSKVKDSYTYFADPGKVKTYLACGVPVLLTNVPWNAGEIEKKKCGFVISENGANLLEKLLVVMNPKINQQYRKNAIKYSKEFNYENIFDFLKLDI